MAPFKSLYTSLVELGMQDLVPPLNLVPETKPLDPRAALSGRAFSEAVLNSEEFRFYIIEGLTEKTIPPAVLCRLIDHGWGKPPDRVEHTGKDGLPIETITEVRRVIVRVPEAVDDTPDVRVH